MRSFGDWRERETVQYALICSTICTHLAVGERERQYNMHSFGDWRGREEVKDTSAGLPPFGPFLQAPARAGACAGVRLRLRLRVPACLRAWEALRGRGGGLIHSLALSCACLLCLAGASQHQAAVPALPRSGVLTSGSCVCSPRWDVLISGSRVCSPRWDVFNISQLCRLCLAGASALKL